MDDTARTTPGHPAADPEGVAAPWAQDRRIEFHAWQMHPSGRGRASFDEGLHRGTRPTGEGLALDRANGLRRFADPFSDPPADGADPSPNGTDPPADRTRAVATTGGTDPAVYRTAVWTSPLHRPGFPAQEVIVSWNARTPGRSWIEVQIQATTRATGTDGTPDGPEALGDWLTMARWCEQLPAQGGAIHRASVDGQADGRCAVDTDTRRRATRLAPPGSAERPVVSLLGAVSSRPPSPGADGPDRPAPASPVGSGAGRELPVPPLSQMTHRGQYPQWGGGGGSWCSPTSVAMAMAYHRVGPAPADLTWVRPPDNPDTTRPPDNPDTTRPPADAIVPFSARATWDHRYRGAGNWAFSCAYPAEYALECFVTRLASLTAMEEFIAAGIPVAASVSFAASELDRAGYSTDGHLLLVVGFTAAGDVIVNDPASHGLASDEQVRTVYRRDQFERVWLPRSGGTVYVIHPPRAPLPAGPATGI